MKFYNISNHPSDGWGAEQLEAACAYGDVEDVAFPRVGFGDDVAGMADAIARRVHGG